MIVSHYVQDTDELLKFRRQWKEELELKQYHEQQGRASGHTSLTGMSDHTPQMQRRKDKEEEVNCTHTVEPLLMASPDEQLPWYITL